jgi:putative DNA-invertase from lambdoid prophage Rac
MGPQRRALCPHHPALGSPQDSVSQPHEAIDTGIESPISWFLLHLLAAFAEMEHEIIRERVRAGVRAAKAKGIPLGRPQRIFRRDEARRLRAEGLSWRCIARTLQVPMSTVSEPSV